MQSGDLFHLCSLVCTLAHQVINSIVGSVTVCRQHGHPGAAYAMGAIAYVDCLVARSFVHMLVVTDLVLLPLLH